MGYGIGLPALIFAVTLCLLLLLYLKERHHVAVELRAWRERLGITQPEAAELLSNLWNKNYPKNPKQFDERVIRRWEAGGPLYPLNHLRIMQIINDRETINAVAAQARRDNLDVLDAFVGERTPSSPPRIVFMRAEAFKDFYAEEIAAIKKRRSTKKRSRKKKH